MKKVFNAVLIFLALSFLSGCTTIYNPATQRKESYLIDTKKELRLGYNLDQELRKKLKLIKSPKYEKRFQDIAPRIIKVCDRQDIIYFFRVVEDKELNAFSTPGGYIYVNTGLLNITTDDELACVLGHEIGHIAARHSIKRLQASLGTQIVTDIISGTMNNQLITQATDVIFGIAGLGYSRQDEYLADKLSVKYAKKAGFDPYALVTFFEKLKKETKDSKPGFEFLMDHPALDSRIQNAKKEISALL